jgi:hypothetical protein
MDRLRLNTQPWPNRLWRVACATDSVGQFEVDMFIQVFIYFAQTLQREILDCKNYFRF